MLFKTTLTRKSSDQIDKDLGNIEFHSPNLRKSNLKTFNIHYIYRWQSNLKFANLFLDLCFGKSSFEQLTPEVAIALKGKVEDFQKDVKKAKESVPERVWSFIKKFKPLLYILMKVILYVKQISSEKDKVAGFFLPYLPHDIWLIKNRTKKELIETIISHEHIHFLQNIHNNLGFRNINPRLLKRKFRNDETAKYLLDRYEIEARLHEMVIAYKNVYFKIPESFNEVMHFLASLPATRHCFTTNFLNLYSEYASREISENGEESDLLDEIEIYSQLLHLDANIHTDICADELLKSIEVFRNKDFEIGFYNSVNIFIYNSLVSRFIMDALPIMYCNLLVYYGYEQLSNDISKSITRPNLYDLLFIDDSI